MNTVDRTNLIIGPFRLTNGELEKVSYDANSNKNILYIVKGRYCSANFINNEKYKDEIKKYLEYEPNTIVYFLCPEDDKESHSSVKYASIATKQSPGIKTYKIFRQTKNQIIQQLPYATSIKVYGHSYGGYFASRLLRELIKYYDEELSVKTNISDPNQIKKIIEDKINELNKLTVVTFGGARFHKYMYQIKYLSNYIPNVRHFIFKSDIIRAIHSTSELIKNTNVIFIQPELPKEFITSTDLSKINLRFIFHNYEPFIKYLYNENKYTYLLNPRIKFHPNVVANIIIDNSITQSGAQVGFDNSYIVNSIQVVKLSSESIQSRPISVNTDTPGRISSSYRLSAYSESMRRPQTVYKGGKGKKKKQK